MAKLHYMTTICFKNAFFLYYFCPNISKFSPHIYSSSLFLFFRSDDDFAACTLINVEFFAALIYHGWLITAHGMIQRPGTPFYFQHNRFGLCSPLPDDPLKFASMGKEAYCIPLILPKLHVHRSLISLSPMGVVSHKSDIKRSRDYFITFNCAFNITTQNCIIQHGTSSILLFFATLSIFVESQGHIWFLTLLSISFSFHFTLPCFSRRIQVVFG